MMNKVVNPCRVWGGERRWRVFCKIAYGDSWREETRLSISGVIGPFSNGNCRGSCGQIRDFPDDYEIAEYTPGWSAELLTEFLCIWKRWHLNDMRPECAHQRELGWHKKRIDCTKPSGSYGKHFPGQERSSWNLLGWIYPHEHPEGLLTKPCPVCGYKYGTAWLREDVPLEVIEFLFSLPETEVEPAWV